MPSCGNCGKEFDSESGVRGHQNHAQTGCSPEAGIEFDEAFDEEEFVEDEVPEEQESEDEELPELDFAPDRERSDGDLFDAEKDSSEEPETEEEDSEVVIGSEDEDSEVEDAEPVELDESILEIPHRLLDKLIAKLLKRKGYQVPEFDEEELSELSRNTRVVADEKLSMKQKRNLQDGSGLLGMVVPYIEKFIKAEPQAQELESSGNRESSQALENQEESDRDVRGDSPFE